MTDNYDGRPFRGTHYEYKVSLGVVMDEDSITWASHVFCKEWEDVKILVGAWREARQFPAVEVNTAWRPKNDHPNAE
jgi:hypothetical protein